MKFHWFHLMPYPYLPDDFRERYHSVWVDLPVRELYDPVLGHEVYNDYLDELEFADQVGFDGICVNEHHSERLRADAVAEPDGGDAGAPNRGTPSWS